MSPTPIIVWAHPRSCSTAFERSLMQRADTLVYHEPLGDPFYYSEHRQCHRYQDKECRESEHWSSSIVGVMVSLLTIPDKKPDNLPEQKQWPPKYIFIKDMAQYIFPADRLNELHPKSKVYPGEAVKTSDIDPLQNPTVVPTWLLRKFKHTFLIRTPEKSVPSYWKCVEEKAAGFEFFDGAEAGYVEQKILYDWIANPKSTFHDESQSEAPADSPVANAPVQSQPQPPPLVNASTLLANPKATVSAYCKAVGIPFEESMLSWDSGPVKEFEKWGTYHRGVESSNGFVAPPKSSEKVPKKDLPQDVQDTIAENIPIYEYLDSKATIKPN